MNSRTIVRGRRRWQRRGTAVGDFLASFALSVAEHVGVLTLWLAKRALDAGRGIVQRQWLGRGPARDGRLPDSNRFVAIATATDEIRADPASNGVRFDDVAGLESAKKLILTHTILPELYPENARRLGISRRCGLLLYGPPGNGKTLLGKAIAAELKAPFYNIRPSDVMSPGIGEPEKAVAELFGELRRHPRAVLFLDEAEAFLPARRNNSSTVMRRLIPQLLAELDGVPRDSERGADHTLLLVGATNEPWMIDTAALRPGRFGTLVYVPLPDRAARRHLVQMGVDRRPVADGIDQMRFADELEGFSAADIGHIIDQAAALAFRRTIRDPDSAVCITADDLQNARAEIGPSVSPADVKRFDEFRRQNSPR